MLGTSLAISPARSNAQKSAALEAVLYSQTFSRADQLKSFLKYVCEMEMAGRGQELTEYLIGIEALGRPASYSPGDDSAVRTRAFALRKKLQEFYEHEHPNAPLRIELPKGSYCPHFVEYPLQASVKDNETLAEPPTLELTPTFTAPEKPLPSETPKQPPWKKSWLLPFCLGVVVTALLGGGLYWRQSAPSALPVAAHKLLPILHEAWGPFLVPNSEVLLCVANPPAFSVLPGPFSPPPVTLSGERPLPPELYKLFNTRYPKATNLNLTYTNNATYWGDVLAALTAFKTLSAVGVTSQMFPEVVTTMPTLRHRNVILVGAPAYSPAVARLLEKCPLQVNYLDAIVSAATAQAPAVRYTLKRDQRERLTEVFGLITVLPGENSANQPTRVLAFSGVNSAGAQAAAEFFSSPQHLLELKQELKKVGHDTFPLAYQVVVRAETDDSILLNFHYETLRLIPLPTSP